MGELTNTFFAIRVLLLSVVSFLIAFLWAPFLTRFFIRQRLGKQIRTEGAPIFSKLHKQKEGIPTMGGIIVWVTALFVVLFFWLLAQVFPESVFKNLNILSRSETLLPLGAMVASAIVGMFDDLLGVFRIGPKGGGLLPWQKIIVYTLVASFGAWWFFFKLEWNLLYVPFTGLVFVGIAYIPIFIFVIVSTAFSTNEADGLDGLAGGLLLIAFGALGVFAFQQGRMDLAAFCGVIIGGLIAFLWHNIYPAKIFLGDTGAMGLGVTLGIIAMLTNTALLLPLIAFVLVLESGSVIAQIVWKKIFKRKLFLSTPLHHHFEAKGLPESNITMRLWIVAWIAAGLGVILGLIG